MSAPATPAPAGIYRVRRLERTGSSFYMLDTSNGQHFAFYNVEDAHAFARTFDLVPEDLGRFGPVLPTIREVRDHNYRVCEMGGTLGDCIVLPGHLHGRTRTQPEPLVTFGAWS